MHKYEYIKKVKLINDSSNDKVQMRQANFINCKLIMGRPTTLWTVNKCDEEI